MTDVLSAEPMSPKGDKVALPEQLMKEAKTTDEIWKLFSIYENDKDNYYEMRFIKWLPVSAVTEHQKELNVKIIKLIEIGSWCVGFAKSNGCDKVAEWDSAVKEVLGVKP